MKQFFTLIFIFSFITLFSQDIEDGVVAHYLFNSDEEMIDQSDSGIDGFVEAATLTEDRFGVEDEALTFDGEFEYAVLSDALDDVTTEVDAAFSISLWHKTGDYIPDLSPLICKYAHTGCGENERQWALLIENTFGIRFYFAGTPDNASYRSVHTSNTVANDLETWYHIVVTYDGSLDSAESNDGLDRVQIFVDNVLQEDTVNFSVGEFPESIYDGNAPIAFMSYVATDESQCGLYNAPGALDDVRIYDRILLDSEVELLFEEGVVGIDEQEAFDESFTLYPTLITNGSFNLRSDSYFKDVRLEIVSLNGQVVQSMSLPQLSKEQTIYLDNISAGTYIVNLRNREGLQSMKRIMISE